MTKSKNIVDKVISEGEEMLNQEVPVKKAKAYWKLLGPGLTTGAADDDPSGVVTYSQAGARYGFGLIWLSLFTFPLMAAVLEMCARIGLVTGRGLARNIRLFFPRWVLYTAAMLLFAANSFNIGADLGAMAKAAQLFLPGIDAWVLLIAFTVLSLTLQIFSTYERYAKYLKYLAVFLLAYAGSALLVKLDWNDLLRAVLIPSISFSRDQLFLVSAVLGTTVSPYLFFWQTSQEVEEEILEGKTTIAMRQDVHRREISKMRVDVWSGMFFSNLVMFFIIAASAAALNANGIFNIETANQAAEALRPIAGDFAYFLFAIGIIGVGMLALPVLAGSASYALTESFGWREGLYRTLRHAYGFYGVIIVSTLVGLAINFSGIDPIKALILSAAINALVSPAVLILVVLLSGNRKIMGDWVNSRFVTAVGWFAVALMGLAGLAVIASLF